MTPDTIAALILTIIGSAIIGAAAALAILIGYGLLQRRKITRK
jgi:hypothetical protein